MRELLALVVLVSPIPAVRWYLARRALTVQEEPNAV